MSSSSSTSASLSCSILLCENSVVYIRFVTNTNNTQQHHHFFAVHPCCEALDEALTICALELSRINQTLKYLLRNCLSKIDDEKREDGGVLMKSSRRRREVAHEESSSNNSTSSPLPSLITVMNLRQSNAKQHPFRIITPLNLNNNKDHHQEIPKAQGSPSYTGIPSLPICEKPQLILSLSSNQNNNNIINNNNQEQENATKEPIVVENQWLTHTILQSFFAHDDELLENTTNVFEISYPESLINLSNQLRTTLFPKTKRSLKRFENMIYVDYKTSQLDKQEQRLLFSTLSLHKRVADAVYGGSTTGRKEGGDGDGDNDANRQKADQDTSINNNGNNDQQDIMLFRKRDDQFSRSVFRRRRLVNEKEDEQLSPDTVKKMVDEVFKRSVIVVGGKNGGGSRRYLMGDLWNNNDALVIERTPAKIGTTTLCFSDFSQQDDDENHDTAKDDAAEKNRSNNENIKLSDLMTSLAFSNTTNNKGDAREKTPNNNNGDLEKKPTLKPQTRTVRLNANSFTAKMAEAYAFKSKNHRVVSNQVM